VPEHTVSGWDTYNNDNGSIVEALLCWYKGIVPEFGEYDSPYCPVEDAEEHDSDPHEAVPVKLFIIDE